jgi:hypothetical protein
MKVKDLIKELSKYDPETEVCVDNQAILYVTDEPAYYDGKLQVVEFVNGYQPVKVSYTGSGRKVVIKPFSISSAVLDYPDLVIVDEYGNPKIGEFYKNEARKINEEVKAMLEKIKGMKK